MKERRVWHMPCSIIRVHMAQCATLPSARAQSSTNNNERLGKQLKPMKTTETTVVTKYVFANKAVTSFLNEASKQVAVVQAKQGTLKALYGSHCEAVEAEYLAFKAWAEKAGKKGLQSDFLATMSAGFPVRRDAWIDDKGVNHDGYREHTLYVALSGYLGAARDKRDLAERKEKRVKDVDAKMVELKAAGMTAEDAEAKAEIDVPPIGTSTRDS